MLNSNTVLILGNRGYVAKAYQYYFKTKNIDYISVSAQDYNFFTDLPMLFSKYNPRVIINCFGYTGRPNVDACEEYKEKCYYDNAIFPFILGQECSKHKIPYIHVSSGCIYTGYDKEYTEEDQPNFNFSSDVKCSWYSGTKSLGEDSLKLFPDGYICRLRIPFDETPSERSIFNKLIKYNVLIDTPNSLSNLQDFVRCSYLLFEKNHPRGIYNITNPGHLSHKKICELMDKLNIININEKQFIHPSQLKTSAPRSNCVLNNDKLLSTGIFIEDIQTSITNSLKNFKEKLH
jgi:dTDP-4-dehydrorhamnose reductase